MVYIGATNIRIRVIILIDHAYFVSRATNLQIDWVSCRPDTVVMLSVFMYDNNIFNNTLCTRYSVHNIRSVIITYDNNDINTECVGKDMGHQVTKGCIICPFPHVRHQTTIEVADRTIKNVTNSCLFNSGTSTTAWTRFAGINCTSHWKYIEDIMECNKQWPSPGDLLTSYLSQNEGLSINDVTLLK